MGRPAVTFPAPLILAETFCVALPPLPAPKLIAAPEEMLTTPEIENVPELGIKSKVPKFILIVPVLFNPPE